MASANGDPRHDRSQCDAGHLTSRQIDVLRAIAKDLSTRLIAEELKISENTVNTHIKAMKKLAGVSKARHLLALAVSQQIIDMSAHPPRWTGVTCIRPWPQGESSAAG